MRTLFCGCLLLLAGAVGGCNRAPVHERPFGFGTAVFTEADQRMISAVPQQFDPYGRTLPLQISCAEPSPDVAKAVSAAFGAGGAVTINIAPGAGVTESPAQIAAAVSRSRAEAFAQLGERMASIQLLRDGLFRACEGFQNGALDEISYSLVLSRIGDTMVSMLGSELIAGEFGRSGASGGGTAAGSGSASFGPPTKEEADKARTDAEEKAVALTRAEAEVTKAEEMLKASSGADADTKLSDLRVARANAQIARTELDVASQRLVRLASAGATSSATASGTGIGGISANPGERASNRIFRYRASIYAGSERPFHDDCMHRRNVKSKT